MKVRGRAEMLVIVVYAVIIGAFFRVVISGSKRPGKPWILLSLGVLE
jgi:hypothetical protein